MASISASPAAGPSRIATATARFSSTTGESSARSSTSYSADDLRPVRRLRGRRLRVHRRDRRLQRVRTEPPRRERSLHQRARPPRSGRGSTATGPGRRAATSSPSASSCASRRESCSSISASSPTASGSGSSSTSSRPSRIASRRQVRARERRAGRRRVALVEHEIDHVQHGVEPLRQVGARRHLVRECARRGSSPSRARCAARGSARVVRNARAISSVVSPHTSRSVSATCASGVSAGWQQVKISRSRSSSSASSSSSRLSPRAAASSRVGELAERLRRTARGGAARRSP